MTVHAGGCQCGAVRFRAKVEEGRASICHCRMCQKAFGNFYAPLITTIRETLVWTKREPKRFASSNHVMRGFCEDCGTPLTYEVGGGVSLAVGAFDDPSSVAPQSQDGCEGKIAYVDGLASLPEHFTKDDVEDAPFLKDLKSFQHPDHPGDDENP